MFAVAPAKHVVLPDQLPAGVAVVSRRPVVQIVFWLDKNESPVEVVYPLEELQAETERHTFSTHDSSWNANGAFIGYERVLDALPAELPVRRLAREAVDSGWRPTGGRPGLGQQAWRPRPDARHDVRGGTGDQLPGVR